METSDTAALARLYADDFSGIGLNGKTVTKAQMAVSNNTPFATLITYDETDVTVRMFGSAAVTTSRASLATRLASGAVIRRRHAVTWLWAQRDDGWRIVGGHMQPMVLSAASLQIPTAPKAGTAFAHLGETEREVLATHLAYAIAPPAEAQRRFAPGYLTVAPTGIVSGPPEAPAANATAPAPPQVLEERERVLIRTASGAAVVWDDFRFQAHGDTVAFTYRASFFDKTGLPTSQTRIAAVYVKLHGGWQQILGDTTEIIADSSR